MLILTLRTDKPEAEIGLFDDHKRLAYVQWQAHRELGTTLHHKMTELLAQHHRKLQDLDGVICFEGPGSFTGLRIGLSVGNALAYGLGKPIVATGGDDWIQSGIDRLTKGESDPLALPEYGAPVHITAPKK